MKKKILLSDTMKQIFIIIIIIYIIVFIMCRITHYNENDDQYSIL
jgi:hypothetical protein